jgi:hypothetical protein
LQTSSGNPGSDYLRDAFVTKLDPLGNLLWSTYLGGDQTDEAHGVKVGSDGTVYVVGTAKSPGFPTVNAFQGECNSQFNICQDAFVARLAANGKSLKFSTFLGGKNLGEVACSVDVDSDGNVFVVGTHSSGDFPFVDAFQDTYGGGLDMFVTKFAPGGGSVVWSTGLGGNGNEGGCAPLNRGGALVLDPQGDVFVATLTGSSDLPVTGGFQQTYAGNTDGYIAKITSDGMLEWGSYLGGPSSDSINEVAVLPSGGPVVVGWTASPTFPQTGDALDDNDCPVGGAPGTCYGDVFVTAMTPDGSALEFSTLLGGSDFEQANGVAVGGDGLIYVGGTTFTELWPLVEPLPTDLQGYGGTLTFVSRIGDANAPVPGDVNGDGAVTASDALAGLSAALGIGQCLLCVCDLNGDGMISATDALIILNLAVGIPVSINPPAC